MPRKSIVAKLELKVGKNQFSLSIVEAKKLRTLLDEILGPECEWTLNTGGSNE